MPLREKEQFSVVAEYVTKAAVDRPEKENKDEQDDQQVYMYIPIVGMTHIGTMVAAAWWQQHVVGYLSLAGTGKVIIVHGKTDKEKKERKKKTAGAEK